MVSGVKAVILLLAVVLGQSVLAADKKPLTKKEEAEVIEAAIRKAAKKPTGELTKADLGKVTRLRLSGTQITDKGLKEVAKLPNLEDLLLTGTKITDAGLKELAKLQKLTILDLDFTKITKTGVAELRKALPNCNIIGL